MAKILDKMNLPQEMKETILTELPPLFEKMDDMAKKVYDPTQIWLESLQFADYVNQLAVHLQQCSDPECGVMVGEQLSEMANGFKMMGENALTVLDEIEKESNGA